MPERGLGVCHQRRPPALGDTLAAVGDPELYLVAALPDRHTDRRGRAGVHAGVLEGVPEGDVDGPVGDRRDGPRYVESEGRRRVVIDNGGRPAELLGQVDRSGPGLAVDERAELPGVAAEVEQVVAAVLDLPDVLRPLLAVGLKRQFRVPADHLEAVPEIVLEDAVVDGPLAVRTLEVDPHGLEPWGRPPDEQVDHHGRQRDEHQALGGLGQRRAQAPLGQQRQPDVGHQNPGEPQPRVQQDDPP